MSRCDAALGALDAFLAGDLATAEATEVETHLAACTSCRQTADELGRILADLGAVGPALAPPGHLEHDLAASPCRRWLGLLFAAVDRESTPENLDRLLPHLESCERCRAAWQDLTLIHQAGVALTPPATLLERCLHRRTARPRTTVLGRRFAIAAAYVLAVLTSLVIGNPVTLARNDAGVAVQRVAETVTAEVAGVAEQGRGELRVMLWRAWRWARETTDSLRTLTGRVTSGDRERRPDDTEGA